MGFLRGHKEDFVECQSQRGARAERVNRSGKARDFFRVSDKESSALGLDDVLGTRKGNEQLPR